MPSRGQPPQLRRPRTRHLLRAAVDAAVIGLAPAQRCDWDQALVAIGIDPAETTEGDPRDVALDELRKLAGAAVTDRDRAPREIDVYTIFGAKGQQWDHVYVIGAYQQGFTDRVALADGLLCCPCTHPGPRPSR